MRKKYLLFTMLMLIGCMTCCGMLVDSSGAVSHSVVSAPSDSLSISAKWTESTKDRTTMAYATEACGVVDTGSAVPRFLDGTILLEESTEDTYTYRQYSPDGSELNHVVIPRMTECESIQFISFLSSGVYLIRAEETEVDENTQQVRVEYTLEVWHMDETSGWSIPLSDLIGTDDLYVTDFCAIETVLLLSTGEGLHWIDLDGKLLHTTDTMGASYSFCRSTSGEIYLLDVYTLYELDLASRQIGAELVTVSNGEALRTGQGNYDFLLCSNNGVRGLNITDRTITELVNWNACDLAGNVVDVILLEEDRFLISVYKTLYGDLQLLQLTYLPAEQLPEKETITMAIPVFDETMPWIEGVDTSTVYAVNAFNRSSNKYRVEPIIYTTAEELNLMMIGEDVPEIVVFSHTMAGELVSEQLYSSKGYLRDLESYINSDPELELDALLPNVIESIKRMDGGLYSLTPSFYINTLSIPSEYSSGGRIQDFSALCHYAQSLPEDVYLSQNSGALLNQLLRNCIDDYVNVAGCSSNFQQQSFYDLLDACSRCSNSGETILRSPEPYINTLAEAILNEKTTICGFPGVEGSGCVLVFFKSFAITEACSAPDGAWAFIRTLLAEENQYATGSFLPVLKTKFNAEFDKFLSISGSLEETDAVEQVRKMIVDTSTQQNYDSPALDIVLEEAEAYFNGDKTAQEVATIIDNRVRIFLSEQG